MSVPDSGGTGQRWDPERYQRTAGFVPALGQPVLELLAPKPGERILDLGCGDGALTVKLVEAGCTVVGVDGSAEQIAAARARGLDAHLMDGHALAFDGGFDAVFSNAALHWMKRPDAVIDGVWRALRPGGRFVAEMGGAGNVGAIRDGLYRALGARGIDAAALDPWYFPSVNDYRAKLRARGFAVETIELFARPTPLPGPMTDWLDTFAESFLGAVPAAERAAVKAEAAQAMAPVLRDASGRWHADYVRLRFAARRPRV
ncbi:MAG: class I SAM-dependent methyltransferase [Candidatus Eiseniibacteriota bacterium]